MASVIRVGVSSCLLGQPVRFDGGHKRDAFLTDLFGRFVEWVPVCPEVESGFGTPRESMRLVQRHDGIRLLTVRTARDLTGAMDDYAERRVRGLRSADLCGYVLKKDSPSCGLARVRVYDANGVPARTGQGRFASRLLAAFPDLPVEEEGRLSDPRLREHFVVRVFAYARLRQAFGAGWTVGTLVRFHTAEKLLLMAHSPAGYQQLRRLVATARSLAAAEVEQRYRTGFMAALSQMATRRRHVNVLQHMAGYVTPRLDPGSRVHLYGTIDEYRRALIPLVVPLTLVRQHVQALDVGYLAGQAYLEPHPRELMLLNAV